MDAPPISRLSPGEVVRVDVASSHFSSRPNKNITLHWRLDGMDTRGRLQQDLARGSVPIAFPHRRVVHAHTIEMQMPAEPMLCTFCVEACNAEGTVIARNFHQYLVSAIIPASREEVPRALDPARPARRLGHRGMERGG